MPTPADVHVESLIEFYRSYRSAIFSTSLTLGTFLFTMKTFIIQTMKKEVYDQEEYKEMVAYRIRAGKREGLYGGLRGLRLLLFWSIVMAILNAIVQISVGYFDSKAAVLTCFISTGVSWSLVTVSLFYVSKNIGDMLRFAESAFKRKMDEGGHAPPA